MGNERLLESKTLVASMEARAKHYEALKEQFVTLKGSFQKIVDLDDFRGKGADAIKGFYEGQANVADAWIDIIDVRVAFFNGISGETDDSNLSGDTIVQVPFLEEDLLNAHNRANDIVTAQQDKLEEIFDTINDIITLKTFSKDSFDEQINSANKRRTETIEKVLELDEGLVEEYSFARGQENLMVGLFTELLEATAQGSSISPMNYDAQKFQNSDVYKLRDEAKENKDAYLESKKMQNEQRELQKEMEALENRPWYEKTWDVVSTFTGEVTGYYDTKRAATGIDPVTGEKLTEAERVTAAAFAAAGFIPVVGWAGRAAKGGKAVYSTVKGVKTVEHSLDAYKSAKAFDYLHKAEYGIYGLTSANGFGEYITGKDMFGNKLDDDKRKQSLTEALFVLGVGGAGYGIDRVAGGKSVLPKKSVSGNLIKPRYSSEQLTKLKSFDEKNLDKVLKKQELTRTEFQDLKLKNVDELTDDQVIKLKNIRESVPSVKSKTILQKTIPEADIIKYTGGSYTEIGGYTARAADVHQIKAYDDVVESSRLEYVTASGHRPYPEDGDTYGMIRFKSSEIDNLDIPYGERFGGYNKDGAPCTQNGFTGGRNDSVVPEYRFKDYNPPQDGAELYKVVNGKEELVAVYDARREKFTSIK